MNRILKKIAILVIALSAMCSCLDKTPGDYLPLENGMKTLTDAEQLSNGIYNTFKGGALYSGYLTLAPDIQADLVYAVEGNSNQYFNLWEWDLRSDDQYVTAVYGSLYQAIGQCNYFLDKVFDLRASMTDDTEIQMLDALIGETYFCRALSYSELLKCFCKAYDPATAADELGVVLADSYFNPAPETRASLKDSYAFVLADLAKADEYLDPEDNQFNAVYPKNAAVHALWARVALYMQDWDAAVEHSSEVIDSGTFKLADCHNNYTSDQTMLELLWQGDASYEIIFKLGYTSTSYGAAIGSVFLGYTRDYYYFYPDFVPGNGLLSLYQDADNRTGVYFSTQQTGYSHKLNCPLLVKYYGNEALLELNIYHVNMPKILRLAEQYLIRAEAYCRQNNYNKASSDLTTLRKSRYTTGGNISVGEDNWLQTIADERARELVMEGFRLHDLKRWHMGFERQAQTSCVKEGSTLKIQKDDYRFVWPIPRNEIEAPGSKIEQNESYR